MVLVELAVEDVDAKARGALLYVRCARGSDATTAEKAKQSKEPPLQLEVMESQQVWTSQVTAGDKPMALDCSAGEYLATLERVFSSTGVIEGKANPKFEFRWSRSAATLTLMEPSAGFAMKYTTLKFTLLHSDGIGEHWNELLHAVVGEHVAVHGELERRSERITELETLLGDKDAVLDRALSAKQHAEDQLFEGFCSVLNAKKDEILRLQQELAIACAERDAIIDDRASKPASSSKPQGKRAATVAGAKRGRPARGAKLKAKAKDDVPTSDNESDNDNESDDDKSADGRDESDNDDHDISSTRKRARRNAIDAYSQLRAELMPTSQRICSSDDVLSDLDAIMRSEVEANEAVQQAQTTKRRSVPPKSNSTVKSKPAPRNQIDNHGTSSSVPGKAAKSKSKTKTAVAPPVKAPERTVDSEEEDILDIFD